MMNEERKQELVEYIELLGKLQESGLKYNLEINQAVEELNSIIMHDPKKALLKFHKNFSYKKEKNGKLVVVNNEHRGIGKTTKLIKESKLEGTPIIVGTEASKNYTFDLVKQYKFEDKVEVYTVSEARGRKFPNGILVDETVGLEQLVELQKYNNLVIRGGFIYSNLFV